MVWWWGMKWSALRGADKGWGILSWWGGCCVVVFAGFVSLTNGERLQSRQTVVLHIRRWRVAGVIPALQCRDAGWCFFSASKWIEKGRRPLTQPHNRVMRSKYTQKGD